MFQVCLVWFSLFSSLLWEMQDSGVVNNFQFDPKPWTHVRINFIIIWLSLFSPCDWSIYSP